MDEKIVKDSQGLAKDLVNDCISRHGVSAWLANMGYRGLANKVMDEDRFPSAQPECAKDFVILKVIDLNGRPYYSIIYLENGNEFEGYSSYDLKVISEYLKRYFGFAQPEDVQKIQDLEQAQFDKIRELAYQDGKADAVAEIIRCRDCKHYTFADNRSFGFPAKRCEWTGFEDVDDDDFCSRAERREVSK